jgi:transcriptional antiterminator Rof (Rho-off)
MNDYCGISCALHSEYELMAMHHDKVEVRCHDTPEHHLGLVADILTRSGAEYMILETDLGRVEIRLDRIQSVTRT